MGKKAKSQFAILGMLALLKKSSGYDLKKHMESSTQYFWKETFSSIYPVLENLEKQKLITKEEKATNNERKRNLYTLTAEGRKTLKNWLVEPPESIQLRNELMLKLFFGTMIPVEVSIEHLEKHKEKLEDKLSTYKKAQKELANDNSPESIYWLITVDHGIRQATSSLEWCDSAIKTLKKAVIQQQKNK